MLWLIALAEGAGGGSGDCFTWYNLVPFAVIFAVMYFLMIRPRQAEAKKVKDQLANLKKNDKVLTRGGIIGIVDRVHENEVILKIDEKKDVRMRVVKAAVEHVYAAGGDGAAKEQPETAEKKEES